MSTDFKGALLVYVKAKGLDEIMLAHMQQCIDCRNNLIGWVKIGELQLQADDLKNIGKRFPAEYRQQVVEAMFEAKVKAL